MSAEIDGEVEVHALIALTVQRVAYERMVDVAHVHANLVRTPRVEVTFDERIALVAPRGLKALKHLKRRNGLTCKRIIGDGHLHAIACGARNTRVDGPLVHDDLAVDERDIATVERTRADEVLQGALRVIVLGGEHEARGVAVEAVHDAWSVLPLHRAR